MRLARGSGLIETHDAAELRRAVGESIARGDLRQIVCGYLELARRHMDAGAHAAAAAELEEGVDVLTLGDGPTAEHPPDVLWRLLLPLALLYARMGDGQRAFSMLEAGRKVAERSRSLAGSERVVRVRELLRAL